MLEVLEIFHYLCNGIQDILIDVVNGINSESIDDVLNFFFTINSQQLALRNPMDPVMEVLWKYVPHAVYRRIRCS